MLTCNWMNDLGLNLLLTSFSRTYMLSGCDSDFFALTCLWYCLTIVPDLVFEFIRILLWILNSDNPHGMSLLGGVWSESTLTAQTSQKLRIALVTIIVIPWWKRLQSSVPDPRQKHISWDHVWMYCEAEESLDLGFQILLQSIYELHEIKH